MPRRHYFAHPGAPPEKQSFLGLLQSQNDISEYIRRNSTAPGGGGGDTDSLSLSTNCETTAPIFGQRTAPVLLPPNLQPPLFMVNEAQPLEISKKWCIFCTTYIIFYQIIVLKGFKNKFEYIQLLFDVEYWMQIL